MGNEWSEALGRWKQESELWGWIVNSDALVRHWSFGLFSKTIYRLRGQLTSLSFCLFFFSFSFSTFPPSTLPDPLLSCLVFFIYTLLINENMKLVNNQSGYSTGLPSILFAITLLCSSVTAAPSNSTTSSKSDPCAAIAGKTTATFHEAKACLDHFPYNETIASQTLDTVRKVTKELYVFNVSFDHQGQQQSFS